MNRIEAIAQLVSLTIATFPEEFSLKANPDRRFRISRETSYYSDALDQVILVLEMENNGKWFDYARGTASEFRSEVIPRQKTVRHAIVVLDDGETYASNAQVVVLNEAQMEHVRVGGKVSDVVDLLKVPWIITPAFRNGDVTDALDESCEP